MNLGADRQAPQREHVAGGDIEAPVEERVGIVIDGDIAATEGDAGKQPAAAGIGIDLGTETDIGTGVSTAADRPGGDRRIGAEGHLLAIENPLQATRRGEHEHDVRRLNTGLEADTPPAHRHHHRRAPAAVGIADTEHPLAVIDAKDEAPFDHVGEDRDPLGRLEHRRGHRFHLEGEKLVECLLGREDCLRFLFPRPDLRRRRGERKGRRPRPGSGGVVARRCLVGAGRRCGRDRLERRLLELHRLGRLAEGGQLGRGRWGEEEHRGDRAQAGRGSQTTPERTAAVDHSDHGESFRSGNLAGNFGQVKWKCREIPPPGRRQFPRPTSADQLPWPRGFKNCGSSWRRDHRRA